ncbi:nucleolar protein 16 [Kwoniella shandongensis]|uniref:Nucleolar protein 16 n=1 Tax=Kwoniella shandongensis TaxID=1734106 RepID=A0A5M6BWQ0_9TREE|nr:nucleolar protein 16 [Kwoniella shandongensis]KAA5527133.1 nucleolar protein 16 [Kwoniella shandongensis]
MANPRQRNKAKSHKNRKPGVNSRKRLRQKEKKAPVLVGPDVLQQGWDKKKTVFQNYAALGLLPSIPIPKGPSSSRSQRVKLPQVPAEGSLDGVKVGFGRIIRDEEGNVVDIVIDEEEQEEKADEEMADEEEYEPEVVQGKTEVVRKLEEIAATGAPVERHTSTSERTWLQHLVDKYDDDTESMAKDHKLNVWQKTEGEIKRMIKKAGGVAKLKK